MEVSPRISSLFDKFHKMENPSGCFQWKPLSSSSKINEENIVCQGELQEIDPVTSSIHNSKYYVVTINQIFRYMVCFYMILG